jgi:hypothetical protein
MASTSDARGVPRRAKLKKILRVGIVVALVIGIGIQFVPVEGIGDNPAERHEPEAPAEVKAILRESCMDCHSHETRWPWYARLAPGSWLMARDVRRARGHFNLSEWGGLAESYRQVDKENAWEQIEAGNMPPRRYLLLHPKARLSDQEKETFRRWLLAGKQDSR